MEEGRDRETDRETETDLSNQVCPGKDHYPEHLN